MAESITLVGLMLQALKRVPLQDIFAQDPYESRRTALKGERLLQVLTVHQLIKSPYLRGVVTAINEHRPLQEAVGGPVARTTLANALAHYPVESMMEAWLRLKERLGAGVEKLGKQVARIALIEASLLKLSLAASAWAEYRQASGAAKRPAVLEWGQRIPSQLVLTPGKVHEANPAVKVTWEAGWTYVQDRGYVSFKRLQQLLPARAHFVVRLKRGLAWTSVERRPVPTARRQGDLRLLSDWTVRLAGWPAVEVRIVSYRLPDGRLVRVLTDRFELTAASVAQLYKERGKRENWWRWIKARLTIKRPLGETANALQLQILGAFVADLWWRVFKALGHFPKSLYEFVTRYQELSLVQVAAIPLGTFRQALEAILKHLNRFQGLSRPLLSP
jgi:Transposase DDE domain